MEPGWKQAKRHPKKTLHPYDHLDMDLWFLEIELNQFINSTATSLSKITYLRSGLYNNIPHSLNLLIHDSFLFSSRRTGIGKEHNNYLGFVNVTFSFWSRLSPGSIGVVRIRESLNWSNRRKMNNTCYSIPAPGS